MRARLRDDLHALGRAGAIPAVVALVGGLLALRAPTATAWSLVATVDALGTSDQVTVDTLTAGEVTSVAGAAWIVGAVVVVVASLVAMDRPPPAAVPLMLAAALAMGAVALAVLLARPVPEDFVPMVHGDDLGVEDVSLPTGVSYTVDVRPTAGPVVLAVGALLVAAGTLVVTRRG